MPTKSPVEKIKNLLLKKRVIDIKDVYKAIHTNSRTTAYRYLQKVDALSSYSHAGKYYTLKEIAQFEEDGLWHYGDISFSKYGTLMDTIVHLVSTCDHGKSCSELETQQRVYVQNALFALVKSKKITRQDVNGVYVYLSIDPDQSSVQMRKRVQKKIVPLPTWVVIQILVATIQCISEGVTAGDVVSVLKKQGSSITRDQVEKVFELHALEKKTLDSKH
jgi:hypothetical protein